MTAVYERARYGEEPDSDEQAAHAAHHAELLVKALLNTLERD